MISEHNWMSSLYIHLQFPHLWKWANLACAFLSLLEEPHGTCAQCVEARGNWGLQTNIRMPLIPSLISRKTFTWKPDHLYPGDIVWLWKKCWLPYPGDNNSPADMAIHGIPSNKTFPSITPLDFGHNMVFEAHAGGAGQSMDYTIRHSYPENSLASGMDGTPLIALSGCQKWKYYMGNNEIHYLTCAWWKASHLHLHLHSDQSMDFATFLRMGLYYCPCQSWGNLLTMMASSFLCHPGLEDLEEPTFFGLG